MKLKLSAIAVALAALAPVAHADVQTSFPDGYVVLSQADKQPIANAQSEWEIRKNFPRGSFRTGDALTPADRAAAPANAALVNSFPQGFYAESVQPVYTGLSTTIAAGTPSSPVIEYTQPDGYRPAPSSVTVSAVPAADLIAAFPQPSTLAN